jgi:hypothetical protein
VHDLAERAFREVTHAFELLTDPLSLSKYRADPERDRKEAQALDEAQRAIGAEREFQKGEARLRSHDWSGALGHFERAVELYPDEGEYLAYCGWAFYLTHGHDDAVFRKAFDWSSAAPFLADREAVPLPRLPRQAAGREVAERMFMRRSSVGPLMSAARVHADAALSGSARACCAARLRRRRKPNKPASD